eukprot:1485408-Rhodomonas_salina.1
MRFLVFDFGVYAQNRTRQYRTWRGRMTAYARPVPGIARHAWQHTTGHRVASDSSTRCTLAEIAAYAMSVPDIA